MEAKPLLPAPASRCERLTRHKWTLLALILVVLLSVWASVKESSIDDRNRPNVLVWTSASPDSPLMYLYSAGEKRASASPLFVYLSSGRNQPCINVGVSSNHDLWLHSTHEASPRDFEPFLREWIQLHQEYEHSQVWIVGHDVELLGLTAFNIVQHNFNQLGNMFVNLAGVVITSRHQWSCDGDKLIVASPSKEIGQLLDSGLQAIFMDESMDIAVAAAQSLPWYGQRAFASLNTSVDHCITDSCSAKHRSYKNLMALQVLDESFAIENHITNSQ